MEELRFPKERILPDILSKSIIIYTSGLTSGPFQVCHIISSIKAQSQLLIFEIDSNKFG